LIFFAFTEETKQKGQQLQTGIRLDCPRAVFIFDRNLKSCPEFFGLVDGI